MGIVYADIGMENLFQKRRLEVKALVDSGSVFLTLAVQLGFDTRVGATPCGYPVPMIGPLRVHFADRYCDLSALVMGDEPLFGAVPMEMMDLVLAPATQTLTVNPANPYVAVALAK